MAEGKDDFSDDAGMEGSDSQAEGKGGGKKKILIIAPILLIALGAGGYFGYNFISKGKEKEPEATDHGNSTDHNKPKPGAGANSKVVLFSMDPFVVNLSEPGRYLKMSMQFELSGEADDKSIADKIPILRDVIITLVGNQTYEYVASAEGKIQLKEEILLRTNRIFGKEVFRNLYFTEFVMQ